MEEVERSNKISPMFIHGVKNKPTMSRIYRKLDFVGKKDGGKKVQ